MKLSKGLAMMGLSTCLSTSLKARGAEWLHALLNKDLGLCFTVYLKKNKSVKGAICRNFSCSVGVRSGMFFENFQEEFLRHFL